MLSSSAPSNHGTCSLHLDPAREHAVRAVDDHGGQEEPEAPGGVALHHRDDGEERQHEPGGRVGVHEPGGDRREGAAAGRPRRLLGRRVLHREADHVRRRCRTCNLRRGSRLPVLRTSGHDTRTDSTMRTTILSAATLTIAALALTQLAPASADGIGVTDPQDLDHGVDLRSVEVAARRPQRRRDHDAHRPAWSPSAAARRARSSSTPTRRTPARSTSSPAATSSAPTTRCSAPTASPTRRGASRSRGPTGCGSTTTPSRCGCGSPATRSARRTRSGSPYASPAPAPTARTRGRTGSASRAASPTGSAQYRAYLTSRTSCGHPQPSATLAAHSRASSIVATSMIVMPPRYSVTSV